MTTQTALFPATHERVPSRVRLVAGRVLYGALLLALVMTPFEIGYPPLGRLFWTTYTNLEATLFLMGGAWLFVMLVDGGARKRLLTLPLLVPVAALVGATLLSTLLGEYRTLGVQTTYRLLMGALVLAAVWEALRGPRRLVWALCAVAVAAVVSAMLGLLEYAPGINVAPWLEVFKPQSTTVGGMLRLSGTFEYANGAAAYFETVTPIIVGLIILFATTRCGENAGASLPTGNRRRVAPLGQIALYIALAVCALALLLTFSRAAWLGVGVAFAVIAAGLWLRRGHLPSRGYRTAWRALGLAAGVIVVSAAALYATQPLFRLRLLGENDRDWYKNTITAGQVPKLTAWSAVTVPVMLRNDGPIIWRAERPPVINLSYHWKEPGESDYTIFEGMRTRLPRDVGPGESVTVEAVLLPPPEPGEYILEWDMVQENVTWFYQKSRVHSPPTTHIVRAPTAGAPLNLPPPGSFPRVNIEEAENYDSSTVSRGQLWRVAWEMFQTRPLTGVGPDGFRNLYGQYAGTTAWNRNIYTNNTYVEMFTNLGIVGGVTFLWLVVTVLWRGTRSVLRAPLGGEWFLRLGVSAALVAFLMHSFVDYFLFSTPLYVTFWLIMGVTIVRGEEAVRC